MFEKGNVSGRSWMAVGYGKHLRLFEGGEDEFPFSWFARIGGAYGVSSDQRNVAVQNNLFQLVYGELVAVRRAGRRLSFPLGADQSAGVFVFVGWV